LLFYSQKTIFGGKMRKKIFFGAVLFCLTAMLWAEEELITAESLAFSLDMIWLFLGAILVFIMQAGFALVETGLTRAKNGVNITMKNVMDFCFGAIAYWALGWGLMYGADWHGLAGSDQFFFGPMALNEEAGGFYKGWFFQVVFAATASTIVSGAVAERTKFTSYLLYSIVISALIYPVQGHWIWGGGWLSELGFHDFAGSTAVHSVGGWAALAGAIVLGPRIGKYVKGADGKVSVKAFPGHNIPYACLGVFLLFFGWFGFNGASTGTALGSGGIWTGANIARVCVTTALAAAAGAIAAMFVSWILFKKPDCSMTLNGVLAGLVSITASCAVVSPGAAIAIGLIGGVLVVLSVEFIDKVLKIDDPVGATSVHLACGIWGTLAVGIWANAPEDGVLGLLHGGGLAQLSLQALGVVSVAAWAFGTSLVLFLVIKAATGLRVTQKEELMGLDITEHKAEAYPGFQIFSNM
jgi:Amt family ammonium transporter